MSSVPSEVGPIGTKVAIGVTAITPDTSIETPAYVADEPHERVIRPSAKADAFTPSTYAAKVQMKKRRTNICES